MKIGLQMDW